MSFWESTCGAYGFNSAPAGGGNWCVQVYSGNFQGCIPGYAYQKLSGIQSSDTYLLSGWAHSETVPYVGLYFGTINNGVITLQAGDTTTATAWTPLSVESSFNLNPGDTAIVVLYGGSLGGPAQGFGYFDLIDLQATTGIIHAKDELPLSIYPNPVTDRLTIRTSGQSATARLTDTRGSTLIYIPLLTDKEVIDMEALDPAVYFISIEIDGTFYQLRIVKD